jgi:hypothetical protein
MNRTVITQIDLNIFQNWTKILSYYDVIDDKWTKDKLQHKNVATVGKTNIEMFDLGALGSLQPLDMLTKDTKSLSFLHGKILDSNLTWLAQLKKDFIDLKLSSVCLCKSRLGSDVQRHKDINHDLQINQEICKLNYILNDSTAMTYVDNNGVSQSYPTKSNTAWLLDVTNDHWLQANGGQLYMLQLCFYVSYNEALEWFKKHPNLSYGSYD